MVSCPSPPRPVCIDPWSLVHPPPPACLYRPVVSCPSPPPVCIDPWSLTHPSPPPVCTDPWSLAHPPHLSVHTHGLLPIPPPTCLYRPMVSYPSPHLSVQTHGLLPIPPPPVCTDPCSLTHPPHLPVQTHGLLPTPPPTCLYRPMVSCLAPPPPPKSGSRACNIVLTTSLKLLHWSPKTSLIKTDVNRTQFFSRGIESNRTIPNQNSIEHQVCRAIPRLLLSNKRPRFSKKPTATHPCIKGAASPIFSLTLKGEKSYLYRWKR